MSQRPDLHRTKLAGNPEKDPTYAVEVRRADGTTLNVGDPRVSRALISLMDMAAVMGGAASHYGGPAAFAEIMSVVHGVMFDDAKKKKVPWHELYNFVNDAGHCENGIYALRANYGFAGLRIADLKGFRSVESKLSGHGEAHLFPESVMLSNGPLGSAFPQAHGLAMADAKSKLDRVTITTISDGACMEGEARESMASLPGLAAKGLVAPFVLVISDNNTKLTGRIDQESFSLRPTFQALKTLGWKVVDLEDGHNLQHCLQVLESSLSEVRLNPKVPIAIHARTIKGIGARKTAESSSGGHGFPLKSPQELPAFLAEILDGTACPKELQDWTQELITREAATLAQQPKASGVKTEKIQAGVATALIKAKKAGLPIISISADLPGSTGVAGFRKEFPQDSFDVGVAESNMISIAAGFSKQGFIPVVDTFAQFGVTKGALPLTMASLSESPMLAIFSHTGFQDAADGASHQALSYLAMVASIPDVSCHFLSCSRDAEELTMQALEELNKFQQGKTKARSFVFFLGRENFPLNWEGVPKAKLGEMQLLHDSMHIATPQPRSVTLVAAGSMVGFALQASHILQTKGVHTLVVNPQSTQPTNWNLLQDCVRKTQGRVVLVEDHQKIFGLNQFLISELVLRGETLQARSLGVSQEFGRSAYNAIDLYKAHHMDADSIVNAALELV